MNQLVKPLVMLFAKSGVGGQKRVRRLVPWIIWRRICRETLAPNRPPVQGYPSLSLHSPPPSLFAFTTRFERDRDIDTWQSFLSH
jgi:hypothetical protein